MTQGQLDELKRRFEKSELESNTARLAFNTGQNVTLSSATIAHAA